MGARERAKRAATAAVSVSLATAGLSSCNDNGAVDPLPPPFVCADNSAGQALGAIGSLRDLELGILIRSSVLLRWVSAEVTKVVNATVLNVTVPDNGFGGVSVSLQLDSASVGSGSFDFQSVAQSEDGQRCEISRTFQFSIVDGVTISLSEVKPLPLGARQMPTIFVQRREGTRIELGATSAYPNPRSIDWTATEGSVKKLADDQVEWTVPQKAGMYQIEVVMDYGDDGFGFDAMAVEVVVDEPSEE
jgi:hypothetical protein